MEDSIQFPALTAVLTEYAQRAEALYVDNLTRSKRVASKDLIQSVSAKVNTGLDWIAVDMNLAYYWQYVEWDTRPHYAPIAPLFRWVQMKPILPTPKVRVRGPRKGMPYSQDELQLGIAYAVKHKIATEGTTGSHDLANTIEALNAEYLQRMEDAITEDLGALTNAKLLSFAALGKTR